jgi:hypothetical protein
MSTETLSNIALKDAAMFGYRRSYLNTNVLLQRVDQNRDFRFESSPHSAIACPANRKMLIIPQNNHGLVRGDRGKESYQPVPPRQWKTRYSIHTEPNIA